MLLIIDNYDSFTYNLVQRVGEIDLIANETREICVLRNDEITPERAEELGPTHLLISPGPCTPDKSGISRDLISAFRGKIPILGVCLGHQSIADLYGMQVVQYSPPVHGKTSFIYHDNRGVLEGLPSPFEATRYHSLVVEVDSITDEFTMSAWTEDGICMGIRWNGTGAPLEGVQFHPESFLTTIGPQLLTNFLHI